MSSTIVDYPVDIWIEILSYLPRTALFKTCTLNSLLFELSLEVLYEEIFLSSSDKEIEETFRKIIRDHHVAKRVRRLHISSPLSQVSGITPTLKTSLARQRKLNARLMYLEDLRRDFIKVPRRRIVRPSSSKSVAFDDPPGADSVGLCMKNLLELSVALSDWTMVLETLLPFLNFLWKSQCIGSNLKKLSYEASLFDLPLLLMPIIRYANGVFSGHTNSSATVASGDSNSTIPQAPLLRNLTHVSVHLVPSPKSSLNSNDLVKTNLRKLLLVLQPSLTSLSISSSVTKHFNHSALLGAIPHLPLLRSIRYHAPFTRGVLWNAGELSAFIEGYKEQLIELAVRPVVGDSEDDGEDDDDDDDDDEVTAEPGVPIPASEVYYSWLSRFKLEERAQGENGGFAGLVLPTLRSLEIRAADAGGPQSTVAGRILPALNQVTPSLTSLTILDSQLSNAMIESIVESLPDAREGGCALESLSLSARWLTPGLFDLLYDKLPRLRTLKVVYFLLGAIEGTTKDHDVSSFENFLEAMTADSRRYPNWKLSYLRIASNSSSCRSSHPNEKVMKTLNGLFDSDPILDLEKTCLCKNPT